MWHAELSRLQRFDVFEDWDNGVQRIKGVVDRVSVKRLPPTGLGEYRAWSNSLEQMVFYRLQEYPESEDEDS